MKDEHKHYCLKCRKRFVCYKGSLLCNKRMRYCNDCLIDLTNYGMGLKNRKGRVK